MRCAFSTRHRGMDREQLIGFWLRREYSFEAQLRRIRQQLPTHCTTIQWRASTVDNHIERNVTLSLELRAWA